MNELTIEHLVPLAGEYVHCKRSSLHRVNCYWREYLGSRDMTVLCGSCNSAKGNRVRKVRDVANVTPAQLDNSPF